MTEMSSDNCFPEVFTCSSSDLVDTVGQHEFTVASEVVENGDITEILSTTNDSTTVTIHGTDDNACAMYTATIPVELAGNLPEGTVFQIMPDATILAVAVTSSLKQSPDGNCKAVSFGNSTIENGVAGSTSEHNVVTPLPGYAIEVSGQTPSVPSTENVLSAEGNMSDIDLSFLNDPDEPESAEEMQNINVPQVILHSDGSNGMLSEQRTEVQGNVNLHPEFGETVVNEVQNSPQLDDIQGSENNDTVMVDVSKPIQLSQNSLIVVDGKKCVLQQDPETGLVIAYPVKEPEKPRRKRGRPRKIQNEEPTTPENVPEENQTVTEENVNASEEDTAVEKGLLEVVTDDGACVRRSSRKRKKAKVLKDYETGNLTQELGSDVEDGQLFEKDDEAKKKARKGVGRPRKYPLLLNHGKRPRGRPRRYGVENEPTQAFLIQTADGQTLMMQVPISSIPAGMSLQDVAEDIANKLNSSVSQNESATKNSEDPFSNILLNENSPSIEPTKNVSEFLNSDSDIVSLRKKLGASQDAVPNDTVAIANDSVASEKSADGDFPLSDVLQMMRANIASFPEVPEGETAQDCSVDFVTADKAPKTVQANLMPDSERLCSNNENSLANSSSTSNSKDIGNSGMELPNEAATEEISRTLSLSESERFADSLLNVNSSPNSLSDSTFPTGKHSKVDVLQKTSASPLVCPEVPVDFPKVNCECNNDLGEGQRTTDLTVSSKLEKSITEEFLPSSDNSVSLEATHLAVTENSQNISSTKCTGSDAQELTVSNRCVRTFDHEYEAVPPVKNIASDFSSDGAGTETITFYDGCSDSASEIFPNNSEHAKSVSEQITSLCLEKLGNIGNDSSKTDSGKEIIPKNNSEFSVSASESDSSHKDSAGQKNIIKRPRGRPRKYPPAVTSILSSQKSLPCSLEVVKSLQDVTSVLGFTDPDFSESVVSATPSASRSSTTVIPVPQKALPLLLPKTEYSGDGVQSPAFPKKFDCRKCEYTSSDYSEYQDHLYEAHGSETKKCKCCLYLCFTQEELVEHFQDTHPRYICTKCNYMSEQPYAVKRHMLRHTENGCSCHICGKTYKDHYILKMHIKIVHMPAEILYKCQVCEKKFNRKAHLKRHLRTHDPDKPYKCSHCEYRGCEKSDITKHMLIHEEPKHMCEICGKSFRHIKNKELHIKRHKGQRDFKCGVCAFYGYTFTDIRKHIERRHKNSSVLVCDKCGQACSSEDQLKEHQNSAQCEKFSSEQILSSENDLEQGAKVDEVVHLSEDEEQNEPTTLSIKEVIGDANTFSSVSTVDTLSSSSNRHIVVSNIGGFLSTQDGEIVISGLETELLPSTNYAIITSDSGKCKEGNSANSSGLNERVLKMAYISGDNTHTTSLPIEVVNIVPTENGDVQTIVDCSAETANKVSLFFENMPLDDNQNSNVECILSS